MCGRFSQSLSREDYLAILAGEVERDIPFDREPIGRYNVAPGTSVLLLSQRENSLHIDPVHWGYSPPWWDKPMLINARVETAASSRMFRPLWERGRAIVFADGWYEWKRSGKEKKPFFIHRADGHPLLMAAIGSPPFERGDEKEGFLVVTAAAAQGLIAIHDRRPLVLSPVAALAWLNEGTNGDSAKEIAAEGGIPSNMFSWHTVSPKVGNPRNEGPDLIISTDE